MTPANRLLTAFLLMLSALVLLQSTFADSWDERDKLAAIAGELTRLELLVDEARMHANTDARIRFRYDWLHRDLERVRHGIEDHLDAPDTDPRRFPAIRGDYRQ